MKKFILDIIKVFDNEEMRILPGNLAFFLILSIVPIITLIVYSSGLLGLSTDVLVNFSNSFLPADVTNLLLPYIKPPDSTGNIFIFMIIGFVISSNSANNLIITSNTLYGLKSSKYIARRIKALVITVYIILLILLTLFILGFGTRILTLIKTFEIINLSADFINLFSLLKWPVAFFMIFYLIKIIYTLSVEKDIKSKYINNGSLFSTIGILIATKFYAFYVENFVNYNIFYGGLSNIIVLMIWIYIIANIIIIGIAINANFYNSLNDKDKLKVIREKKEKK
jgi:membrane protein